MRKHAAEEARYTHAFNRTDDWSKFMSRMRHQFEQLLGSKPTCLPDMDRSSANPTIPSRFSILCVIEFLGEGQRTYGILPGQMQRQGYYASVQAPWLVCSKSRSTMTLCCSLPKQLVLAASDLMLAPVDNSRRTKIGSGRLSGSARHPEACPPATLPRMLRSAAAFGTRSRRCRQFAAEDRLPSLSTRS